MTTERYPWLRDLAVGGLLLLAVGAVFGQTVRYDFVNLDDPPTVYENPHVLPGLTAEGLGRAFTHAHFNSWVPLTCISQMLDCQLYGLHAGGHHLTNVLLHAATVVLLFLVLRQMTGRVWPSALAAALFAVHPLQVEPVAWVSARKDVLCGLFFVLTLWAYVGYVRHPFSLVRYLAVVDLFCLGMMAKPMLVTLPLVLLMLDYWPLGRFGEGATSRVRETHRGMVGAFHAPYDRWRLVIEKLPLLAVAAVFSGMAVWAQGEALEAGQPYSLPWRMGNALMAYAGYLGHFFYPVGLAVLYPRAGLDLPWEKVLGASLLLVGVTAAALLWRRRCPYLLVGWLWYLVMLLPVIGLVQFGAQAVADRFMYLPQIGLGIALAWTAAELCGAGRHGTRRVPATFPHGTRCVPATFRRGACVVTVLSALAVLAACAWRQTTFWQDSETLWTRTLDCTSDNIMAHHYLGIALSDWGLNDDAMLQYLEVRKLDSRYVVGMTHSHAPLTALERFQRAATHYRRAVDRNAADAEARRRLAWLLATCPEPSLRNGAEAVALARQADDLCGHQSPQALDALAAAYAEAGRFPQALAAARRALALATQQGKKTLAGELSSRIALYEAGKAFHQP